MSTEGAPGASTDEGKSESGVTFNDLVEDSSMCLLLLSLWLCVVGVMLRNLYDECRVHRNFVPAGFLFTCLLIGIGGGYGAALTFNSYDERVDLVYIGYVTMAGFGLTFLAVVLIMSEYVWWKLFHSSDWIPLPDIYESDRQGSERPHGDLLGKSGSFNIRWITDWLRGGPSEDREYNDYRPVDKGLELDNLP